MPRDPKSKTPEHVLTPQHHTLIQSAMPFIAKLASVLSAESGKRLGADELTAIGYLAAVEAAPWFDARRGKSFEAFASKAVRGAMRDELARERLRGKVDRGEGADDGGAGALVVAMAVAGRPSRSPEELLDRGLERERVLAALEAAKNELPEQERAIVEACVENGEPANDVGRSTGFSARVVRSRRDRAIEWLGRELREHGIDDEVPASSEPVSDRCR